MYIHRDCEGGAERSHSSEPCQAPTVQVGQDEVLWLTSYLSAPDILDPRQVYANTVRFSSLVFASLSYPPPLEITHFVFVKTNTLNTTVVTEL